MIDGHLMISKGSASKSTKIWGSGIIVHLPLSPYPTSPSPVPQAQTAWIWYIYILPTLYNSESTQHSVCNSLKEFRRPFKTKGLGLPALFWSISVCL